MKISKLGILFVVLNSALIVGVAAVDGLLAFNINETQPSETRFLSTMIFSNFFPFLLYGALAKIRLFYAVYMQSYYFTIAHFLLFGGMVWYLVGFLISKITSLCFSPSSKK